MPSTKFTKKPPVYDKGVRGDATSYLKNYTLFMQRIMWGMDDRNPNMPEKDLKRYISKLVDPLAFQGGHTEEVEAIEKLLDGLNKGEVDRQFRVKTIVRNVGSYGGILSSKTNCVLWTVANLDHKSTDMDETVHIPSSSGDDVNWTDLRVTTKGWNDKLRHMLSEIQEGDEFEIFVGPSEEGKFEVGFNSSR